jgi:two-component system NtrC family sensor kinase
VTGELLGLAGLAVGLGAGFVLAGRRASGAAGRELARAREEASRRVADVFALQELSYALSESLQPRRIAEQIVGYVNRFTDVDGALVALTGDAGRNARVAAASGVLAALRDSEVAEADPGLLVASLGREEMLLAEESEDARPVVAAGVAVRRAAVFPLRAHGVTVGILAVADPRRGTFDQQTLKLLATVSAHAAIVLSNARFFDLVRAGRDQWETTFNALAEGLAVVDEHNRIRRANRALAALVGSSTSALSNRVLPDVFLPDSAELPQLLDAARQGRPTPPLTGRTPRDRVLRIAAAPMRGEGSAAWAVVLVEDVTEQAHLESQLIQSEKMAAVGQLVSGVAHELNNPLTSIAGLAEFLLEQPAPGDRDRDHLRVIREQADRATQIVRNLLTFARKGPADVEPYQLNELVDRTVALVAFEAALQEIAFDLTLDPSLPELLGDRYQIQQVVLNLVTNAIHAVRGNPPGRARRVRIATALEGDLVTLRVADSGPGIDSALLPHIFTPFFTTKDPGHGTGLGLSISYRILEGHGGSLSVEQPAEGGAVFVVRLPARPAPAHATASAGPARSPATAPAAAPQAVLIVDEDPAVRRMLTVLLAAGGRRIDTAADATQATALLRATAYDLVMADARVPVSAGERFADFLGRDWPQLRSRTIFLTADVRPDTEAWLRGLGCPFFFKPFRIAELKTAIAQVLDAGPGTSGRASSAAEHRLQAG